ncbi:hypothetical protein GCM10009551_107060 [Nocardiopsis tropica]|uniref:hypothetical protein n=1 Tax=Tsukamurella strandjordii TaxID=147577 RepID=UPI0031D37115
MSTIIINPVSGPKYQVQTIIADQVAFSHKRRQAKWPAIADDPLLAQNYIAFAAARREGKFTGTWDDFGLQTAEVTEEEIDDDEFTTVTVDADGNKAVPMLPNPTTAATPPISSPPSPSAPESPPLSF